MQNYVHQLLTDMAAAQKNLPTDVDYALLYPDHPATAYGLTHLVEYEMSPRHSMDDLFGIKAEQLPPVETLTDAQIEQLNDGILSLWSAFNFHADTKEGVPPRILYKVLRDYWATEKVQYMSVGMMHIEFCDYNPDKCPWGNDYCTCKDFANEPVREFTPEEAAEWRKGLVHHADGSTSWTNPEFLDENGNFDSSKLLDF
jgi:hypothetical protein